MDGGIDGPRISQSSVKEMKITTPIIVKVILIMFLIHISFLSYTPLLH
jgi:hypothetical protein